MLLELLFPTPKMCPLCGKKQEKLQICNECYNLKIKIQKEEGQCSRCGTFSCKGIYRTTCYSWPDEYIKIPLPFPTGISLKKCFEISNSTITDTWQPLRPWPSSMKYAQITLLLEI